MKKRYEAPELRELGTLEDLTLQQFNKIGRATDVFTQLTNNQAIGSLTNPQ